MFYYSVFCHKKSSLWMSFVKIEKHCTQDCSHLGPPARPGPQFPFFSALYSSRTFCVFTWFHNDLLKTCAFSFIRQLICSSMGLWNHSWWWMCSEQSAFCLIKGDLFGELVSWKGCFYFFPFPFFFPLSFTGSADQLWFLLKLPSSGFFLGREEHSVPPAGLEV